MDIARFNFDMYGSDSFSFQHLYTKPLFLFNKKLIITLPSGEVLSFVEAESQFPSQLLNVGNNGDLGSEVLADLDELGYDLQDGTSTIMVNIEQLKEDILLNPEMFTKNGAIVPFSYTEFPDGVYTAVFSFQEAAEQFGWTDGAADEKSTSSISYVGEKHALKMCRSLACRAEKIEEYYEQHCQTPTNCRRRKELSELITRMRMLELGALWDFSQGDYGEASSKLEAMILLCKTGKCNYKVGC